MSFCFVNSWQYTSSVNTKQARLSEETIVSDIQHKLLIRNLQKKNEYRNEDDHNV